jgi:CheY-like chemotaxis protein
LIIISPVMNDLLNISPHVNKYLMKILIIDDDAEDTEIFCHALKDVAPDVNCLVVNNPRTGLTYLAGGTEPPEYIFLDANMNFIDGKDCLKELRKMEALKNTKIIMYSGYISEKQLEEMKKLGADRYLNKPNSYEDLRRILASVFVKN